jgi:hypothetical protein
VKPRQDSKTCQHCGAFSAFAFTSYGKCLLYNEQRMRANRCQNFVHYSKRNPILSVHDPRYRGAVFEWVQATSGNEWLNLDNPKTPFLAQITADYLRLRQKTSQYRVYGSDHQGFYYWIWEKGKYGAVLYRSKAEPVYLRNLRGE